MVRLNPSILLRKKKFDDESVSETKLSRVLGILDVCAIGISSTLGSGIYILAGAVITKYTGPSVIFSFIIAGIATFLSGICYAELGARVPRSGSAYVYIYVTIGEFVAFMMGWDLILEYIIGTASGANALSQYIDFLFDRKIRNYLTLHVPMNVSGIGAYPDFLAFALALVVTGLMIIGVKESATVNKIFTLLNIILLAFIIVCGATKANFHNWNLQPNSNSSWIDIKGENQTCASSKRCGKGGFLPFDFSGVIDGAAKCFYAYIGFDVIASTGEEVVNPKRNIPLSILITLGIVSLLYCGLSAVLTLMIPYYILDSDTPLPHGFEYANIHWAKYIVSIGAILSLASCLYAGMFPMPRIVYSMASDGLIFKFLAKILPKLKTPFVASIVTGLFAAILASIFDLNELVDMMSIGTLMAYTLVSICVLILRYRSTDEKIHIQAQQNKMYTFLFGHSEESFFKRLFLPKDKVTTSAVSHLVNTITMITLIEIVAICVLISKVGLNEIYSIVIVSVLVFHILISSFIIWRQPQVSNITTFKIPLVPFIPFLSVFVNVYMMTTLAAATWLRFIIWFLIGACVYFFYGIRKSKENVLNAYQNKYFPIIESSRKVREIEEKIETTKF